MTKTAKQIRSSTPGQTVGRERARRARVTQVYDTLVPGTEASVEYVSLITRLSPQAVVHAFVKLERDGCVYRTGPGKYKVPSDTSLQGD